MLSKILRLSSWTLAAALFNLALQLILFFFVARHIAPAELGTYFLASALVFIPMGILEYSFTSSLIHKASVTRLDYQAVLKINLIAGLIFLAIGVVTTYFLASYYDNSDIFKYYLCLSSILLLWQATSIQNAGLKKNLRFKQFSLIDVGASLVNFLIAMGMIKGGYGVESLIAGQLGKAAFLFVTLSLTTTFIGFSFRGTRALVAEHIEYGKYIMGEKSFGVLMGYTDTFLVHHFLGVEILGIYDLLKRIIMRPLTAAYVSLEQVIFPLLTKANQAVSEYKELFRNFTKLSSVFMLCLLMALMGEELLSFFPIAYQEQVDIFLYLIIYSCSLIVSNPIDIVSYSLDMTEKYFRWAVVSSLVQLLVMIVSLQWGLPVMLISLTVSSLVLYMLSYSVLFRTDQRMSSIDWARPVHFFILLLVVLALLIKVEWPLGSAVFVLLLVYSVLHFMMYRSKSQP